MNPSDCRMTKEEATLWANKVLKEERYRKVATKETRPVRGQITDEEMAYLKKVLEAPVELFVQLV